MTRAQPRRFDLVVGLLVVLGFAACSDAPDSGRTPTGRDLVLIVIDTLRADRVSCYGYDRETTPTLDRLARDGARVDDCTAHSSWTGPSIVALMTGRRVARDFVKMAHEPTLAERLKAAGYATIGMQWNGLLKAGNGFERGFDRYLFQPRAAEIGAALLAMPAGPRFVYVHLTDPHDPYAPSPEFDRFEPRPPRADRRAAIEEYLAARNALWSADQVRANALAAETAMQQMSARYDGEVAQADQIVNNLLGVLARIGRRDCSVIVVTSDHGESLFEHREAPTTLSADERDDPLRVWKMGHSALLAEALLRVPLILQGPGVPGGVVLDGPQEHVDVLPTVFELLGLDEPAGLDGTSLVPAFAARARGEAVAGKDLVFANSAILTSVRTREGWKLVLPWPSAPLESPKLFDLRLDPAEQAPMPAEGDVARRLARAIESFRSTALLPQRAEDVIDAETRRRMEELGYLGGR